MTDDPQRDDAWLRVCVLAFACAALFGGVYLAAAAARFPAFLFSVTWQPALMMAPYLIIGVFATTRHDDSFAVGFTSGVTWVMRFFLGGLALLMLARPLILIPLFMSIAPAVNFSLMVVSLLGPSGALVIVGGALLIQFPLAAAVRDAARPGAAPSYPGILLALSTIAIPAVIGYSFTQQSEAVQQRMTEEAAEANNARAAPLRDSIARVEAPARRVAMRALLAVHRCAPHLCIDSLVSAARRDDVVVDYQRTDSGYVAIVSSRPPLADVRYATDATGVLLRWYNDSTRPSRPDVTFGIVLDSSVYALGVLRDCLQGKLGVGVYYPLSLTKPLCGVSSNAAEMTLANHRYLVSYQAVARPRELNAVEFGLSAESLERGPTSRNLLLVSNDSVYVAFGVYAARRGGQPGRMCEVHIECRIRFPAQQRRP